MTSQHANQTKTADNTRASQPSTAAKAPAAQALHPMLQLQQQIGNRAVGRLIQAKLTVGEANDAYEQEADQGEKTALQKSNNTGLPDNLKVGIEALSGYSMDNVRVHYNSSKPAEVQALAYAQGTDIHLAPGQEKHLPHEAWHVVQQAQGRVQPTMQMKNGVLVNDNEGLEHEADVMGENANKSVAFKFSRSYPYIGQVLAGGQTVTQLLKVPDDHVRGDLRHQKFKSLFTEDTIKDIEGRAGGQINRVSNQILDAAVHQSREEGKMEYLQLSQRKVTSEKQMTDFLEEKPDDEHMYVLDDDELHVAIRAEEKKLPHPTLVGGDPDVQCAGTLRFENEEVVVTCSSGHFRPRTEGDGKKAVEKIMKKTARKDHVKNVKGKRR